MKLPLLVRRVQGQSMSPNLKPGQIVIVWNYGKPKVGEIIIFRHNGLEKIKRIDKIEHGSFFVIGDSPSNSTDSRQFGSINKGQIIGRVVWPRNIKK